MYNFQFLFYLLFAFVVLTGCNNQEKQNNETVPDISITSENLDDLLLKSTSVADVQALFRRHPSFQRLYFSDFEGDSIKLAKQLFEIYQNDEFRNFKTQIDSIIGDRNTAIIKPLQVAFSNIKKEFPQFKTPKLVFMMSGFAGNDFYISDSLIVIGLDYFGGSQAQFRPNVFDYQLKRYQKENIVPAIIYFISNRFNKTLLEDKTLLADMISIGKDFEFVKQILPDCPDSLIIGYSADNLRKTYNSQTDIWAYFISQKLLYEKNTLKKEKYIGERPFTMEIGNQVPGGIARWIGWRIVSKYIEKHPKVTLSQLMSMDKALDLFEQSGYNGEKDEAE